MPAAALSETQAIGLAAELSELVVRLRCLEAKYTLENSGGPPSFEAILDALRPFSSHPKVSQHAFSSGFNLEAKEHVLAGKEATFERQATGDSLADASTTWGSRKVSCANSACSGPGVVGMGHHVVMVPPRWSTPEAHSVSLELDPGASVLDLRRAISRSMKLPLGKVGVVVTLPSGHEFLDDKAEAARATNVFIKNLATPLGGIEAPTLDHQHALELQRALLRSLSEQSHVDLKTRLARAQAEVLPQFGFQADAHGLKTLLGRLDELLPDDQMGRAANAINDRLGLAPQLFDIHETQM